MDDSPFRRIVLPALLASSAGFAALTLPLASTQAALVSQRLPHPLNYWVDSALMTSQHKEFSIRYIGFAILSSVSIGVGTAGAMRRRQAQVQRHESLLSEVLAEHDDPSPAIRGDAGTDGRWAKRLRVDAAQVVQNTASGETVALVDALDSAQTALEPPTLDWASLLWSTSTPPEEPALASVVMSTSLESHQICQILGADQQYCLALKMGDEYYRFYRQRPSLDRTQTLVQQLQRRGQRAIATRDGNGYVVWVHQPDPITPSHPWPQSLVTHGV